MAKQDKNRKAESSTGVKKGGTGGFREGSGRKPYIATEYKNALEKRLGKEIKELKTITVVNKLLAEDAVRNFQFLMDVRDGKIPGSEKNLNARVKCAEVLAAKVVPNVTKIDADVSETKRFVVVALSDSNVKLNGGFTEFSVVNSKENAINNNDGDVSGRSVEIRRRKENEFSGGGDGGNGEFGEGN